MAVADMLEEISIEVEDRDESLTANGGQRVRPAREGVGNIDLATDHLDVERHVSARDAGVREVACEICKLEGLIRINLVEDVDLVLRVVCREQKRTGRNGEERKSRVDRARYGCHRGGGRP